MADVSNVFVTQYQAEVQLAYQRQGSKLRPTVRVKSGIVGATTKFPKIGKGTATQKTRHADVTPMNVDHQMVTCQLEDWYAPDYVDKLDEFKINYDERQVLALSGAYAVGRKVDELLLAAATTGLPAGQIVGTGTAAIDLATIMSAFERINDADVPDDGQRFAWVGPKQWNQLLMIDQFAKSNYVKDDYPWLKGTEARRWLNTIWQMHTGLPKVGSSISCLWYHRSALGLAENSTGILSEINYVPEKVAHLCNNMIGAGSCRIDNTGIVMMNVLN